MKVLALSAITCLLFFPLVLTKATKATEPVKDYLTPTTGKWLYPHNETETPDSPPPQTPGTATATDPTNVQIVQKMLAGFAQQVNANTPAGAEQCLDEKTAMVFNAFFYSVINKLANSDFMTIPTRAKVFQQDVSASTIQCWKNNQAFENLLGLYGVQDMGLNNFYSKLANYTYNGNYQDLIDQASSIRSAYETQQYENAGSLSGQLLQAITNYQAQFFTPLKTALLHYSPLMYFAKTYSAEKKILLNSFTAPNATFQDLLGPEDDFSDDDDGQNYVRDLRNILSGVYGTAKLKAQFAQKVALGCFSEEDAKLTLDALAQVLAQVHEKDLYNLPSTVDNLTEALSTNTTDCLSSKAEVQKLVKAFNLQGKDATFIYNQIDSYIVKNGYESLENAVTKIENEIKYAGMEVAGEYIGKVFKTIVQE